MKLNKNEYLKHIRIIALILLSLILFRGILLLFILIILSLSLSYIVNKLKIRWLGIELVTFIAILAGQKYGPLIASIITFVLITYHMIAGGFIGNYVFWVIPAYTIAGLISGLINPENLIFFGTIITTAINLNNITFTTITSPTYLPKYLPYAITNILFNIFLISTILIPAIIFIA